MLLKRGGVAYDRGVSGGLSRCAGIVTFLVVALVGAPASAQPRAVDLVFIGDATDASGLTLVLTELLDRLEVELRRGPIRTALDAREVLTPDPEAPPALARVWIEAGEERTTLYLVDGDWERILVRHVPLEDGLDEVGREQVAHIVYAAVEALIAGARIGLTRDQARQELGVPAPPPPPEPPPPPPEPPPPPPEPPPPSELSGDVSFGYLGQLFADGATLRHAVGARGALLVGRRSPRLALSFAVDFFPTTGHEGAGVQLGLRSWVLRFEAGVDFELSESTSVRATGGLGVDLTSVEPAGAGDAPIRLSEAFDAVGPLLVLRGGVHQQIWEWLGVSGGLLLDVDLVDARYVVAGEDGDLPVIDPWLVRPSLWVALEGRFR